MLIKKNENEIIFELSSEIEKLINNKDIIDHKRKKSFEKINDFNWENKVLRLYKQL